MAADTATNAKAFGGVIAVVALVAGVYAMVEPMGQRIDFLERQLESANAATKERARLHAESVDQQFAAIDGRTEQLEEWQTWWYRSRPESAAVLQERIRQVERVQRGHLGPHSGFSPKTQKE